MRWFFFVVGVFLLNSSIASDFIIDDDTEAREICRHIESYVNFKDKLTISDIVFDSLVEYEKLERSKIVSFEQFGEYVFRLALTNSSKKQIDLVFTIHNPAIQDILFLETKGNELFKVRQKGLNYPSEKQILKNNNYAFLLQIPAQDEREFYFKISNDYDIKNIPVSMETMSSFHNREVSSFFSVTFYYGIMVFSLLFTLLLYVSLRNTIFIYHALYIISISLFLLVNDGIAFIYFWPKSVIWNKYSFALFGFSSVFLLSLVLSQNRYILRNRKILKKVFAGFMAVAAFGVVASIGLIQYRFIIKMALLVLTILLNGFIIYVFSFNKENRIFSGIVLWGHCLILTGLLLQIFNSCYLPESIPFLEDSFKLAVSLQIIGVSFALSEQFRNILSRSKEKLEFEVRLRTVEVEAQKDHVLAQNNYIQQQNTMHKESLEYARNIQKALFPETTVISTLFKKSFLLFKPKDIVSGDFYWAAEYQGKKIIVCADCTGHGIPGAFLSILGITSLAAIVSQPETTEPHIILNKLREKIIENLSKKNDDDYHMNDGMDAGVCVYDEKERIMEYAGAYNPIYIFRQNQLIHLRTDHMPVGDFIVKKSFTKNHIKLEPKDRVYLFTDGYADQIGGDKVKKMKRSGFKNLLTSIQRYDMPAQKIRLEKFLREWSRDFEQVDDITVIGFEIE